jgi:hypothetical protein
MIRTLTVIAFLLAAAPAYADWHLYLVPSSLQGTTLPAIRPNFDGIAVASYSAHRYGGQSVMLVAANVDDATDAGLAAKPDITKVPDNLDQQVGSGAALTITRNAFENRGIPGSWIVATTTYREALRVYRGASEILQRYRSISGIFGPVLGAGGVTLDTAFSSLPLSARNNLIATAKALNLDTSGFTGASTLRQILKGVGDQYAARPFRLGGIVI